MKIIKDKLEFLKTKFGNEVKPEIEQNENKFISKEYDSLIHGVGLRVLDSSVLNINGKDYLDFLHRVSTNDLKNLKENQRITTLFTNEKGRIIDRTILMNFNDNSILIGNSCAKEMLIRWINKFIIMENVKVRDVSGEYAVLELLGPQAESYLTLICGNCVDNLDFENIASISVDGFSTKVIKLKETDGSHKFWLLAESDKKDLIIENITGQESVFDFSMISDLTYNLYRIEKGIPVSPNEINDNYNPHEANIIHEVSFTKGCYIGQEVIARLDTYDKVQKELKIFRIKEAFEFNGGDARILNDKHEEIGTITSAARCLNGDDTIALGYIKKKFFNGDSSVKVNFNGSEITLEIEEVSRNS